MEDRKSDNRTSDSGRTDNQTSTSGEKGTTGQGNTPKAPSVGNQPSQPAQTNR